MELILAVSIIAGLVNLVLFIIVLVKLFQVEGALKGILGLICSLYTFIWGWTKHKELNITQIMWAWTALVILSLVLSVISQGMAYSNY